MSTEDLEEYLDECLRRSVEIYIDKRVDLHTRIEELAVRIGYEKMKEELDGKSS
jgi:hypothetical protein